MEDPEVACLAGLRDNVQASAVMGDGRQLGRIGVVVVPDVVVHGLEIPDQLAGAGVERDQAVAEEVRASAVRSIEVVLGACRGHEEHPALCVQRHAAPCVRPADCLPCVLRPGVVAGFTGMRHGVEGPRLFACKNVEGAHIARS